MGSRSHRCHSFTFTGLKGAAWPPALLVGAARGGGEGGGWAGRTERFCSLLTNRIQLGRSNPSPAGAALPSPQRVSEARAPAVPSPRTHRGGCWGIPRIQIRPLQSRPRASPPAGCAGSSCPDGRRGGQGTRPPGPPPVQPGGSGHRRAQHPPLTPGKGGKEHWSQCPRLLCFLCDVAAAPGVRPQGSWAWSAAPSGCSQSPSLPAAPAGWEAALSRLHGSSPSPAMGPEPSCGFLSPEAEPLAPVLRPPPSPVSSPDAPAAAVGAHGATYSQNIHLKPEDSASGSRKMKQKCPRPPLIPQRELPGPLPFPVETLGPILTQDPGPWPPPAVSSGYHFSPAQSGPGTEGTSAPPQQPCPLAVVSILRRAPCHPSVRGMDPCVFRGVLPEGGGQAAAPQHTWPEWHIAPTSSPTSLCVGGERSGCPGAGANSLRYSEHRAPPVLRDGVAPGPGCADCRAIIGAN